SSRAALGASSSRARTGAGATCSPTSSSRRMRSEWPRSCPRTPRPGSRAADARSRSERRSARRDQRLELEQLVQVEVRDERIALPFGLPQRDVEAANGLRPKVRREGEPFAREDEERYGVQATLVHEHRRASVEEGLDR